MLQICLFIVFDLYTWNWIHTIIRTFHWIFFNFEGERNFQWFQFTCCGIWPRSKTIEHKSIGYNFVYNYNYIHKIKLHDACIELCMWFRVACVRTVRLHRNNSLKQTHIRFAKCTKLDAVTKNREKNQRQSLVAFAFHFSFLCGVVTITHNTTFSSSQENDFRKKSSIFE